MKENIIVKEKRDEYRYDFTLHVEKLSVGLSADSRSIELYTQDKREDGLITRRVEYVIPEPFMYDAAGALSDEVYYEMERLSDTDYLFSVVAESSWLNDESRAMPVTIDPQVVVSQNELYSTKTLKRGLSSYTWSDYNTTSLKVSDADINGRYKGVITIFKRAIWVYPQNISKVLLKLTVKNENLKQSCVKVGDYFYNCDTVTICDITKQYNSTAIMGNVVIDILPNVADIEFFSTGTFAPVLEIEYLINKDIKPCQEKFDLVENATGIYNVHAGEFNTEIHAVKNIGLNALYEISLIYKKGEISSVGNNFRLNLDEKLGKTFVSDVFISNYIYTDIYGNKHGFKEYYYYFNEENELINVDKDQLIVDLDGTLWFEEKNKNDEAKKRKVKVELRSDLGIKVAAKFDGDYRYKLLEQSQNEQKQLEEQVNAYKNSLEDFVCVFDDGIEFSKLENNIAYGSLFKVFLKYAEEPNIIVLTKSEALSYRTYFRTEGENGKNVIALKEKKEGYLSRIKDLYKAYENKKFELENYYRQMPVNYLIDDDIIKGFNEKGDLVTVADNYGNMVAIERNTSNYITRVYNEKNCNITFSYNYNGNLEMITDANGNKTKFSYTGNNLTKITYSNGKTLTFTYADSQIASIESSDKLKVNMDYEGNLLTSLTYRNLAEKIEHGKTPDILSTQVKEVTFEYNANQTLITCSDNLPTKQQYTFNEDGNLTEYILEEDNKVTKAEKYDYKKYEKNYIVYAKKDTLYEKPLSTFQFVPDACTNITLNDFNNPTREETSLAIIGYDNSVTPAVPVTQKTVTTYTYDSEQRIEQETTEITTAKGTNQTTETAIKTYAYNSQGSVVRTESYIVGEEFTGGKTVEETVYDDKGRVIKSFAYNSLDPSSKFYTENEYAEDGKITAEIDETGENKTNLEYADGTSAVRTQILPNGSQFSYGHDTGGTVTAITQSTASGEENSTQIAYTCGEITQIKSGNNVAQYTYDYKRRKTSVNLNDTKDYVKYKYEDVKTNNVKTGEKVTATYAKRSDNIAADTFETISDLNGNILLMSYNNSPQMAMTYEKRRLKTSTDKLTQEKIEMDYDVLGRLTSVTGGRATENYEYNTDGNLSKKTVTVDGENTVYDYDYKTNAAKDLKSVSVGEISVFPQVDCLGRSTGKEIFVANNGSNPVASEQITYRKAGDHATNVPSAMRFGEMRNGQYVMLDNLKYAYDACGNISEIRENGTLYARYSYDKLNRITREDNKKFGKTWLFSYDNNGNILSKREFAFTLKDTEKLEELPETQCLQYAYDGDRLMALNSENFVYDVLGNPTTYRNKALVWEKGRQLKQYGSATFEYNGRGQRTKKTGGTTVTYVYDNSGKLVLQDYPQQGKKLKFFYDFEGLCAVQHGSEKYYYRHNAQGDVIALLDTSGKVVVKYEYDAWGSCKVFDAQGNDITYKENDETRVLYKNELGNLNPFRYRGYYYDVETGLYFLKTRYYDPEIGRFITIDDLQYLDPETINGLNLYAYCGNNPIMAVDPEGTKWWKTKFLKALATIVTVTAITVALAALTVATFGIGTAVATGIVIGAAVGGAIAGGVNLAVQVNNKGWDNIDYVELGVSTFFGGVAGGISGGLGALSPTGTIAQKAAQGVLNSIVSVGSYIAQSAIAGSNITLSGIAIAATGGFISGATFNLKSYSSLAVALVVEFASYYKEIWQWIKKQVGKKY
ncbi:MAG: RHS repeat-associated core domain-containing protein [Clostridia bacterium]|nr:RHS repeat-associated core domain-containing protein [Clostridia bacterium]